MIWEGEGLFFSSFSPTNSKFVQHRGGAVVAPLCVCLGLRGILTGDSSRVGPGTGVSGVRFFGGGEGSVGCWARFVVGVNSRLPTTPQLESELCGLLFVVTLQLVLLPLLFDEGCKGGERTLFVAVELRDVARPSPEDTPEERTS